MKKPNLLLTLASLAAAFVLGAGHVQAQAGGGGGGGRNFDPAQFQQRILDNIRDQLGFTNDAEWTAVQPIVQKVMDAYRDAGVATGMMRILGRGNRGGGPASLFSTRSLEEEALQKAIEDNAPAGQIKNLLAKFKAARKERLARLEAAQADLRQVLTMKQEAQATLLGLLQ